MCASAIAQSRVARLVYGAADPLYGAAGSVYRLTELPTPVAVSGGWLEAECRDALRRFFQFKRKH